MWLTNSILNEKKSILRQSFGKSYFQNMICHVLIPVSSAFSGVFLNVDRT